MITSKFTSKTSKFTINLYSRGLYFPPPPKRQGGVPWAPPGGRWGLGDLWTVLSPTPPMTLPTPRRAYVRQGLECHGNHSPWPQGPWPPSAGGGRDEFYRFFGLSWEGILVIVGFYSRGYLFTRVHVFFQMMSSGGIR